jgi:RsiW-degrading membrane proteinase PrsW (M82 family)
MTTLPFERDLGPPLRRRPLCRVLGATLIGFSAVAVVVQLGLFFTAPGDAALVFMSALAMSSVLTALPVWLLWNLERRERVSASFFAAALLWGGFIATALAIPVNSFFFQAVDTWVARHPMVESVLGPEAAVMLSAPISAPIAEELAKALGVAVIFAMLRGEFNSVRDGIVYGALVGIGFNWYETALYVAQEYAKTGVAPYGLQLGGRFALFGFGGHALFSGIFGGFLGYALVEPRWLLKISAPIVGLLLERGRFTPHDTAATATALMCYAPGLLGYSAVKIASPSFYSLRDSRTPVTVGVISVLTNLGLNLLLVRVMGYRGLALGTAIAAMVNAGTLLWLLRRRLSGLEGRRVAVAFSKILVASIVMGAAANLTAAWLGSHLPHGGSLWRAVALAASIATGVAVLVASARVLRIAEFDEAFGRLLRRLRPAG